MYGSYIGDLFLDRTFIFKNVGLFIVSLPALIITGYFIWAFIKNWDFKGELKNINLLCLIWIASYFIFFIWWDPRNIDFMVPLLIPGLVLFAIFIDQSRINYRTNRNLALVLLILLFPINFFAEILPGSKLENNYSYQLASTLKNYVSNEDLVLIADPLVLPYSKYYFHKDFTLAFLSSWDYDPKKEPKTKAIEVLKQKIDNTLKMGGKIFIAESELYPWKPRQFKIFSRKDYNLAYKDYKPYLRPIFTYPYQGKKCKMYLLSISVQQSAFSQIRIQ